MKLYAVFLPLRAAPPALEQAVFVKQGFSFGAFALTPFWALCRRLWLAFGLWVVWLIFVAVVASLADLGPGGGLALYVLGALAFGLEADRLREARLAQSGFALDRLAMGFSQDDAESLYYETRPELVASPPQRRPVVAAAPSPSETDLLGLFPRGEREL